MPTLVTQAQAQTFTATAGNMSVARRNHAATRLNDGTVLIVGGNAGTPAFTSAELYNPTTQTFSATGSMLVGRDNPAAVTLNNGTVLVAGGASGGSGATAEIYNPTSHTFAATGSMSTPRAAFAATKLNDGSVLITGGFGSSALASAEVYDPTAGTFTVIGSMTTPRYYHTSTLLSDGTVLIIGGTSNSAHLASAEVYYPATHTFAAVGSMGTVRYYHSATLLGNGMVLIAGGNGSNNTLASTEIYNPSTQLFAPAGAMSIDRSYPSMSLLNDGKVLVAAGYAGSQNSSTGVAELFDPASQTFSTIGSMVVPRHLNTATLLSNGSVLFTGGYSTPLGAYQSSAETYNGPTATLTGFTPASGQVGTQITITGTGFLGTTSVTFNGTAATYTVDSATQITATVPTGATTGPISVVTPSGTLTSSSNFTVTSLPLVVTTTADTTDATDGATSLREAITYANSHAGADTITFAIPGTGVQTIQLASALPTLTDNGTTIDGYSQLGASANTLAVGSNAVIEIQIKGTGTGSNDFDGLRIYSANCTIQGLDIAICYNGINIVGGGANGNKVIGNYIGVGANGTSPGVNTYGVHISNYASNNIIGGATSGERNILSGNSCGIYVDSGATGNKVTGNYIGLAPNGTTLVSNSSTTIGVFIADASNNTIGGTTSGERNVIAGNKNYDVYMIGRSTGNKVSGNYIGANANGVRAFFSDYGVRLMSASNNTIGGTTSGERNVICGHSYNIYIEGQGATGNKVSGNYIGVDASGTTSAQGFYGVYGVYIASVSNNTIGGTTSGEGNVISGHAYSGVYIIGSGATGNKVTGNSIYNNGGLGIDLYATGVTANDTGDGDTGPNNLQNFPVLTSAISGAGNTVISGTLNSTANSTFTLDFYASPTANASGYGEGQTFLGSNTNTITTDANGNASFAVTLTGVTVAAGQAISATATDSSGNTSEFSQDITNALTASIGDASVTEGNSGTSTLSFPVTLNGTSVQPVSIDYATADGTATAPGDYTAVSGTLTIPAGSTSGTISVLVNGDTTVESDETLTVNLSNAVGATLANTTATGTITNDDVTPPTISIGNVTQNEGNSGTTAFTFTVSLNVASSQTITVNYATADGSATAPGDYTAVSGTLTFAPGTTTQTVTVLANGDTTYEPDETFTVNLSSPTNATIATGTGTGTITNDDAAPTLSINNVTQNEGNSGTTAFTFTVTLSGATSQGATVNYATADGTATAGSDYTAASGTLTFAGTAGETHTITVLVNGDAAVEPNETFFVNLSNAVGATINTGQGTGTIQNDDAAPTITSFTPASGPIGTSVTITGTGFTGATVVRFNGTAATSFTVGSATSITATVPTGATTGPIGVTTPSGAALSQNIFTVQAAPTITSFTPTSGPVGTTVTITGTNFTGATSVQFNGTAATSFMVNSATSITATVPSAALGTQETISVITPGGTANSSAKFTVTETSSLVVNTTSDSSTNTDGLTSLREAIAYANSNPGADTITFNIPGTGVQTIQLNSPLSITGTNGAGTVINGYSQAGASVNTSATSDNAVIKIEVRGNGQTSGDGFLINTSGCTVKGLAVYNCAGAIHLTGTAGTGSTVVGNFIGLTADGSTASGSQNGVFINSGAFNNTIGGSSIADRNVISSNSNAGVYILGTAATGNKVIGNYIGVAADGVTKRANSYGVDFENAPNNMVGGSGSGEGNVIAGNTTYGVYIVTGSGNKIQGNSIGVGADGITALSNGYGIYINGASTTTVGGVNAGEANFISGNATAGVYINGAATGNRIRGNSIYANGTTTSALGIDLVPAGVTANDNNDTDTGPNNLQNFPVLGSALVSGTDLTVSGTLNSTANSTFTLDFYSSPTADASGYGEGQTYLGSTTVTTSGNNASFNATLSGVSVAAGASITATATDANGNTSEFSQSKVASPAVTASVNNVKVTEGNSGTTNATFTISLSSASNVAVTVSASTADGSATAPSDYVALSGTTVTFAPGETSKTVTVQVNGDSTVEPDETFTLTLSNPSNAILGNASGTGTIQNDDVASSSSVMLSEFRLSGPGGARDEYIELYNPTGSAVDLTGWTLSASNVTSALSGLSLSGKSIPAYGYLLLTNSGGYSLGSTYPAVYAAGSTTASSYATGDVQYTGDIALSSTLTLTNNAGVVVDASSDLSGTSGLNSTSQYAFVRRMDGASTVNTGANSNDFNLVDIASTAGASASNGTSSLTTGARLGAPGPQNSASPVRLAALTLVPLSNSPVTPEGRYASKGTPLDTFGRLSLRRTITNTSNQTIKQIRFTLVRTTSGTSSDASMADLRALTSSGVSYNGSRVCYGIQIEAPTTPTIPGASLTSATTGNGGGLNSSWNVGTLPAGGLAPGQSINVEFTFGILKEGNYDFALVATVGQ